MSARAGATLTLAIPTLFLPGCMMLLVNGAERASLKSASPLKVVDTVAGSGSRGFAEFYIYNQDKGFGDLLWSAATSYHMEFTTVPFQVDCETNQPEPAKKFVTGQGSGATAVRISLLPGNHRCGLLGEDADAWRYIATPPFDVDVREGSITPVEVRARIVADEDVTGEAAKRAREWEESDPSRHSVPNVSGPTEVRKFVWAYSATVHAAVPVEPFAARPVACESFPCSGPAK